ncbi:MAG: methyl-accepting chemotaxis protein [Steroidobacteraceae bacterium]
MGRAAANHGSAADALEWANLRGQVAALERSQAVIEFALDGTILTANEHILSILGYSLEEVRGKHHRMFIDGAFAANAEYRAFWERLARGEFCAGQYRLIGKGARELWLQGAYNPILDPEGKPFKVVNIGTDITAGKLQVADLEGKLRAIDKVQAIIEFDLDGTIRDANENFLRVVGYSMGEIRGKHHRMFVDPAFAGSAQYRDFWAKLARGEHDSGEYCRLAKDAREVWLQASYTPILDANGRPLKVVKFATDITERKRLTQQLDDLVGRIRHAVAEVTVSARDIADGNASLSQRVEQQAASLEEIAGSMKEMTQTVQHNSQSAAGADHLAGEARASAERGGSVVSEAVEAMDAINTASRKISAIIGVIDEIAFQTNLLALNAAVEAARAGEQGRGFAVVASEVRNLAGRSASAAKEIKALIQDSGEKVADGSRLVMQSGESLRDIVAAVKKVTDIVAEIAAASGEQTSGIDQIARAVTQMNEVTQQNAALVEQASAASESILHQVDDLAAAVGGQGRGVNGADASDHSARTPRRVSPRDTVASPERPARKRTAGGGREEWVEF